MRRGSRDWRPEIRERRREGSQGRAICMAITAPPLTSVDFFRPYLLHLETEIMNMALYEVVMVINE